MNFTFQTRIYVQNNSKKTQTKHLNYANIKQQWSCIKHTVITLIKINIKTGVPQVKIQPSLNLVSEYQTKETTLNI